MSLIRFMISSTAETPVGVGENRFRRFSQAASNLTTVVDIDAFLEYVAPSAERLLGHSQDDLLGELAFEYMHPENRTTSMEEFGELVSGILERMTTEFRFERPAEEWIWLEVKSGNPLDVASHRLGGSVAETGGQ